MAMDDSDSDGIAIGANKLTLNGGSIRDPAGNEADLTHDSVPADSGHMVDGVSPTVSSLSITSDPGDDDTYGVGDSIEVTVTFSEVVIVADTPPLASEYAIVTDTASVGSEDVVASDPPLLELDIGGTANSASYSSASGATVVYSYTVAVGDTDTDGNAIGANKLSLNDGTIQDAAGNDAILTHDAVAADSGHLVDGSDTTAPTISSVSITSDPGSDWTYGAGDTIKVTVTFSERVTVTGTSQLELNMYESNPSARPATYSSDDGSGTAVVFAFTVAVGDSASDGLAVSANKLSLNGGTIQDGAENDAVLTHDAVAADSEHKVSAPGGL